MTEEKRIKATDAVKALAEKNGGTITPEIVLEEAKRKASPLHAFFCWDNTKAANEYRKIQAAVIIRRIKVTYTPSEGISVRVRAFVNVVEPNDDSTDDIADDDESAPGRQRGIYVGFEDAMHFDNYKDQVIRQCKRDVESFRSKYAAISEASKIIAAMDDFTSKLSMD